MKTSKARKEECFKYLLEYKGQKFLACIKSVSPSGMSRRISFYAPGGYCLNHLIGDLLEYSYNEKGLRVDGCGMDMVFSVLSGLNYKMAAMAGDYDKLKAKGERIYDNYFTDANRYVLL